MNDKPAFNFRSFTSYVALLCFTFLTVSGVVLYVSPRGRVANWTGWSIGGLSKHDWSAVHITIAVTFIVAVAFHIYFNWSFLGRYLKDLANRGFHSKRELGFSTVVVLLVFVGTQVGIAPFSTVGDVGERFKDYWEVASPAVPYAHAEESTIAEFAVQMKLPLDQVTKRLYEKGFIFDDANIQINDLAEQYGVSPGQLFSQMSQKSGGGAGGGQGLGGGAGMGAGGGMGWKTLSEVSTMKGVLLEDAIAALAAKGITAEAGDTMRGIAEKNGLNSPHNILTVISGE
jgi:hypothetical protein